MNEILNQIRELFHTLRNREYLTEREEYVMVQINKIRHILTEYDDEDIDKAMVSSPLFNTMRDYPYSQVKSIYSLRNRLDILLYRQNLHKFNDWDKNGLVRRLTEIPFQSQGLPQQSHVFKPMIKRDLKPFLESLGRSYIKLPSFITKPLETLDSSLKIDIASLQYIESELNLIKPRRFRKMRKQWNGVSRVNHVDASRLRQLTMYLSRYPKRSFNRLDKQLNQNLQTMLTLRPKLSTLRKQLEQFNRMVKTQSLELIPTLSNPNSINLSSLYVQLGESVLTDILKQGTSAQYDAWYEYSPINFKQELLKHYKLDAKTFIRIEDTVHTIIAESWDLYGREAQKARATDFGYRIRTIEDYHAMKKAHPGVDATDTFNRLLDKDTLHVDVPEEIPPHVAKIMAQMGMAYWKDDDNEDD